MSGRDLARIALVGGTDPRAILQAAIARPFNMSATSVEFDPQIPVKFGGGLLAPGENALAIPDGQGADKPLFAVVNKVTPEQLLAIVASIICSAPTAAVACSRLRQEIAGWQFQYADGKIG